MSPLRFQAKLFRIGSWTLLRLPKSASKNLPSRGLVLVKGTLNGFNFEAPLEPDGEGSHWLRVDKTLQKGAKTEEGDTATLEIEPLPEWPEPEIPDDLQKALAVDSHALELWLDVTTKARWDWIRWIRSTKNPETRQTRIAKTISKLKSGKRNPCCFNRSMCTEPSVSKGGILLDSDQ